jgi:hypothetical protein
MGIWCYEEDAYVCDMLELESVLQLDTFLLQSIKGYSGTQPNGVKNNHRSINLLI